LRFLLALHVGRIDFGDVFSDDRLFQIGTACARKQAGDHDDEPNMPSHDRSIAALPKMKKKKKPFRLGPLATP
jgi:hypothetical protein